VNLMPNEIDPRLKQLIALWIDGTSTSLQCVPEVCDELYESVVNSTGRDESKLPFDGELLRRVGLLSAKAEQRLEACLEIQSRTGSYSTRGALELSARVVTAGWEG
jgi:hypothetical protein